jgi:hypothetical protein
VVEGDDHRASVANAGRARHRSAPQGCRKFMLNSLQ